MRKLFLILFLLISYNVIGQPIVNRAGQANTVSDARWQAQFNLFTPRYTDTTSANLQKGIDSCGAVIFTYDINGLWFRQCSPKKWVAVSGGGSQNLQQVTDIGNSTTNYIFVKDGPSINALNLRPDTVGFVKSNVESFLRNGSNGIDSRTWRLPDSSGTIALLQNVGGAITASNGLTRVSDDIRLGGSLSQTNTIVNNSIANGTFLFQNVGANRIFTVSTKALTSSTDSGYIRVRRSGPLNIAEMVQVVGVQSFNVRTGITAVDLTYDSAGVGRAHFEMVRDRINIYSRGHLGDNESRISISTDEGILNYPDRGKYTIDTLNYTLSTTGKKIMLRDTATGLVQNIDPSLITPATPTWQQTLTAGSTLTGNNSIGGGGFIFNWDNMGQYNINTSSHPTGLLTITDGGIVVIGDGGPSGNETAITVNDNTSSVTVGAQNGMTVLTQLTIGQNTSGGTGILRMRGETSGTISIQSAATAGTYTLTLPTDDGTSGQYLQTDGSGVLSWQTVSAGGSPAGNYGNVQLNRNGVFATPASDSLIFLSTGFTSLAGAFSFTGENARIYGNGSLGGVIMRYGAGDANAVVVQTGSISMATSFGTRVTIVDASTTIANRLRETQGADVASAAGAITLGSDGNSFEITGTASITLISNVSWQNGSEVTLVFTSTATLVDGTANSGTDIGMELAGNTNFTAAAGQTIKLQLLEVGGTQRWRQVGGSLN